MACQLWICATVPHHPRPIKEAYNLLPMLTLANVYTDAFLPPLAERRL